MNAKAHLATTYHMISSLQYFEDGHPKIKIDPIGIRPKVILWDKTQMSVSHCDMKISLFQKPNSYPVNDGVLCEHMILNDILVGVLVACGLW